MKNLDFSNLRNLVDNYRQRLLNTTFSSSNLPFSYCEIRIFFHVVSLQNCLLLSCPKSLLVLFFHLYSSVAHVRDGMVQLFIVDINNDNKKNNDEDGDDDYDGDGLIMIVV